MTIFRWLIGVISALLAAGSLISLALFLALDAQVWLKRARSLRRGLLATCLIWFNVEVWGRVILTIVHW